MKNSKAECHVVTVLLLILLCSFPSTAFHLKFSALEGLEESAVFELKHRFQSSEYSNIKGTEFLKLSAGLDHQRLHSLYYSRDGVSKLSRKKLLSSATSEFPVQGEIYPSGLYRCTISLGSPEQTFNVVIDTGSSLTWVNCLPCQVCTTSQVQQLNSPFDSGKSSSFSEVSCNSPVCSKDARFSNCSSGSTCQYSLGYADGSSTTGSVIQDLLTLSTGGLSAPVPLPLVFGCGNFQTGTFSSGAGWTIFDAVDGLLGLGRGNLSLPVQLAQRKGLNVSHVFTLCLGSGLSGGLLAIGDSHVPKQGVVYTPLVADSPYFLVRLVRVLVSGSALSVPPAEYGAGGNAVFDSGTTYTHLPLRLQRALMALIRRRVGLTPAVDSPANGTFQGFLCYNETVSLSVTAIANRFPRLNLQFRGRGKFLNLPPSAYTFVVEDETPRQLCTRVVPSSFQYIIIGDIWMRNFLFVHDLDGSRLGWTPMDCA